MNWRSPRLLAHIRAASLAGELPCYWYLPHNCTAGTPGTVVYAHSNQLIHGKGKGIKSHDYRVAFLCFEAHYTCDQGSGMAKSEKFDAWDDAHVASIGWLIERGLLVVT